MTAEVALTRLAAALHDGGPTVLNLRDEISRDKAVAASVNASLNLLTEAERDRFVELGIFAEDIDIPRDMIILLWRATGGLYPLQVDQLVQMLASLSLVADYKADAIRLHDVIRTYLRQLGHDKITATNDVFVDAPSHTATVRQLFTVVAAAIQPRIPMAEPLPAPQECRPRPRADVASYRPTVGAN